ncbi:MAG TPA: glycosyltransferase family 39 protein [Thermoanaerobaculia bacterium]|jgi:4-amino-4-deoxy-L-arabinose transferase-like glycosyltransferase|nr:glycosyltransferase family 39 protein [Thermoanaerobaculia bacterium]
MSVETTAQPKDGRWIAGLIALAYTALHLAVIGRYGWFRDELYYIACGEHLDWGYVDHPPLVALITRLARTLLGDSILAARLPSVLAGAAVIFLAGLLAREMGGGRFAQALAALCAVVGPVYLFMFHILSMNSFDVLFWTLGAFVVVRILNTGNPRLWLLFGLICGLGLENKHSLLFFGFGVFAGLLLTPERRQLRQPWIWIGGALAVVLFLPHVLWQIAHGWPTAEFIRNATAHKNVALSPLAFFAEQIKQMHPLTFPVWFAGLVWLFRSSRYRVLAWVYVAAFLVLITQSSKAYYLAPAYPPLFAAGAVAFETWIRRPVLRAAVAVLLLAGGAVTAPLTLPVLSEEGFVRYAQALGIPLSAGERHEMGALPQHYADMHGWEEMVAEVARVYNTLPPEEKAKAGIFAQNYGEAGAVDLLGRKYGLPKASSGHNNYFLWGPQGAGEILIIIGGDPEDHRQAFQDVRQAGEILCGYCMPYENNQPVWIARGLKEPIDRIWPMTKHYG